MQHLQAPLPVLPNDLQRFQPLLASMMCKDREKRIQNATALVAEVEKLQLAEAALAESENVEHAQPSVAITAPKSKHASMRPVWMTLGGVTLFALGSLSFWLYAQTLTNSRVVLAPPITSTIGKPPPGVTVATSATGQTTSRLTPAAQNPTGSPPIREVVRALEWLARNALQADRLTSPPADNAYYYYSRLLALAPDNQGALAGFGEIAER